MELSPPASLVVRSPRQTVSLLRNRRPEREREGERDPPTSLVAGPNPSEVYGFVGSITTVTATAVYLVWAYTPEPCLHSLGITYYPTKYWALAVPSLVMVAVALSLLIYMGFNFLATPPPTSFNTIFDEYSRERTTTAMLVSPDATTQETAERPIEPISDISIHRINNLMFAHSLTDGWDESSPVQIQHELEKKSSSSRELGGRRRAEEEEKLDAWPRWPLSRQPALAKCATLYSSVGLSFASAYPTQQCNTVIIASSSDVRDGFCFRI